MFSGLATKIALKKVGLPSNALDFSWVTGAGSEPKEERRPPPKGAKDLPPGAVPGLDEPEDKASAWPAWMTVKALPLTVQPWLSPPPPPIPVAESPKVGDLAPLDRDRKLTVGGGKRVLVVFLRCVGCACKFPHDHATRRSSRGPGISRHRSLANDIRNQSRKRPSSASGPSPAATQTT